MGTRARPKLRFWEMPKLAVTSKLGAFAQKLLPKLALAVSSQPCHLLSEHPKAGVGDWLA